MSAQALAALDQIWRQQGGCSEKLSSGTRLWHGGLIGPQWPMADDRLLWTTRIEAEKHHYDGQAREFAAYSKVEPYRLELELTVDAEFADFRSASLLEFTKIHCNYQHPTMKKYLTDWVSAKGLGGVVAINGGPGEVAVRNPSQVLAIRSQLPL